eukprot:PhF_6_TR25512/c1_g2_i9/m.35607
MRTNDVNCWQRWNHSFTNVTTLHKSLHVLLRRNKGLKLKWMRRRRYWSRCQSHGGKHSQQAVHSIVQSHLSTNDVHCMQQQQWSATELEKLQDKLTELESELRDVDET